jgi:hypothetical protein
MMEPIVIKSYLGLLLAAANGKTVFCRSANYALRDIARLKVFDIIMSKDWPRLPVTLRGNAIHFDVGEGRIVFGVSGDEIWMRGVSWYGGLG